MRQAWIAMWARYLTDGFAVDPERATHIATEAMGLFGDDEPSAEGLGSILEWLQDQA